MAAALRAVAGRGGRRQQDNGGIDREGRGRRGRRARAEGGGACRGGEGWLSGGGSALGGGAPTAVLPQSSCDRPDVPTKAPLRGRRRRGPPGVGPGPFCPGLSAVTAQRQAGESRSQSAARTPARGFSRTPPSSAPAPPASVAPGSVILSCHSSTDIKAYCCYGTCPQPRAVDIVVVTAAAKEQHSQRSRYPSRSIRHPIPGIAATATLEDLAVLRRSALRLGTPPGCATPCAALRQRSPKQDGGCLRRQTHYQN